MQVTLEIILEFSTWTLRVCKAPRDRKFRAGYRDPGTGTPALQ